MKEKINTVSKCFAIQPELFDKLTEYCEKNNLNRSAVIRTLIEKFLKENRAV